MPEMSDRSASMPNLSKGRRQTKPQSRSSPNLSKVPRQTANEGVGTEGVAQEEMGTQSEEPQTSSGSTQSDCPKGSDAGVQTEAIASAVRRLPQFNGASYAATVAAGPVAQSTDPVYQPTSTLVSHKRPEQKLLRKVRFQAELEVEEELFQYLRGETWYTPLDETKLPALAKRAKRFFMDYDGCNLTKKQQVDIMMKTTIALLKPDPLLTELRNTLKNRKDLEEAIKNGELSNGVIGNTGGLFSRTFTMPKKKK